MPTYLVAVSVGRYDELSADAAGVPLTQWSVDLNEPIAPAERLARWLGGFASDRVASATLVNNAGVVGVPAPLGRVPLAEISQAISASIGAGSVRAAG